MTVLAWDGTNLAVESRSTVAGIVCSDNMQKMFAFEHATMGPMVGAMTGACDFFGPWIQKLEEEGFVAVNIPGMDDDYMMQGLFIDGDGNCWQASTNGGYFFIGKEKSALGSAMHVASYLLQRGKSALAAVREAAASNIYCGGSIRNYNSKTGKITLYEA